MQVRRARERRHVVGNGLFTSLLAMLAADALESVKMRHTVRYLATGFARTRMWTVVNVDSCKRLSQNLHGLVVYRNLQRQDEEFHSKVKIYAVTQSGKPHVFYPLYAANEGRTSFDFGRQHVETRDAPYEQVERQEQLREGTRR